MPLLTRRHVLAGAAATAAVAAMPAVSAITAVEEAPEAVTYLDPALMAWTPGRLMQPRELFYIGDRLHVALFEHVAGDVPSDSYISRALRIEDGLFVEEDA